MKTTAPVLTPIPVDADVLAQQFVDAIVAVLHTGDAAALHECFKVKSPAILRSMTEVALVASLVENHKLHERIKALEARPAAIKYCGVFDATRRYSIGDVISDHGSAWIATKAPIVGRPGYGPDGSRSWVLMVKKGHDGRDGRNASAGDVS